MRRGIWAVGLACALSACVTTKDAVGGGDARLDEATGKDPAAASKKVAACGPDVPGQVTLLDARTGGPVGCLEVALSQEPSACAIGTACQSDRLAQGLTGPQGQLAVAAGFTGVRLVAVADGFAPSYLLNASRQPGKALELELAPIDGFWLKVLDADGNYLQNVLVNFTQGEAVVAHLRSNPLANVFFPDRQPFSGDPVVATVEGFQPLTISGPADLGEDGHTLVLKR